MGYDEEIKCVRNMLMKHCKQYTAWCLPPHCAGSGYLIKLFLFLWKNISIRFRVVNCNGHVDKMCHWSEIVS